MAMRQQKLFNQFWMGRLADHDETEVYKNGSAPLRISLKNQPALQNMDQTGSASIG
jgi:hypothetical protein